ncbi:MAG TPA: LacI family DNA-binding transcriptional regulator [Actinocrinis sp.]|nr:LacI family DNA-binding transcriptional regulator [Actinocrinis sp.]
MAATLETVAEHAGVSRATVSRVINRSPKVSPEARERVQAAIRELGFVPNRAARTLVTRRTDSIALIIPEPDVFFFADPYLTRLASEINHALDGSEIQLVLLMQSRTTSGGTYERMEDYCTSGHVDGVILASVHDDNPLPRALINAGIPVVYDGRPAQAGLAIASVDVDNVLGARQAAEHLVAGGRRLIGTITGPTDMTAGLDRLAGYHQALEAAGLAPLVANGSFTEQSGTDAMLELLEREPELDAVFAASDLMARGALTALAKAGRRVPQDVALVGFDDLGVAQSCEPGLSSVRQPIAEVAAGLVRLLTARIGGQDAESVGSLTLATTLTVRESSV